MRRLYHDPPDATPEQLAKRTLTGLYNARPAWLAEAHATLDRAVWAAYGWPDDPSQTTDPLVSLWVFLGLVGRQFYVHSQRRTPIEAARAAQRAAQRAKIAAPIPTAVPASVAAPTAMEYVPHVDPQDDQLRLDAITVTVRGMNEIERVLVKQRGQYADVEALGIMMPAKVVGEGGFRTTAEIDDELVTLRAYRTKLLDDARVIRG